MGLFRPSQAHGSYLCHVSDTCCGCDELWALFATVWNDNKFKKTECVEKTETSKTDTFRPYTVPRRQCVPIRYTKVYNSVARQAFPCRMAGTIAGKSGVQPQRKASKKARLNQAVSRFAQQAEPVAGKGGGY